MSPLDYLSNKVEVLESNLIDIKNELKALKLNGSDFSTLELLRSEKARVKLAISISKDTEDASKILGISDRTFYRLKRKHKL